MSSGKAGFAFFIDSDYESRPDGASLRMEPIEAFLVLDPGLFSAATFARTLLLVPLPLALRFPRVRSLLQAVLDGAHRPGDSPSHESLALW